jgi:hypothetical protein
MHFSRAMGIHEMDTPPIVDSIDPDRGDDGSSYSVIRCFGRWRKKKVGALGILVPVCRD